MNKFFVLPLFGASMLIAGCSGPTYVEGGPAPLYGPRPVYAGAPGYYAPGPVYGPAPNYYGGTTVVSVEHDRSVDNNRYYYDTQAHPQSSRYNAPTASRRVIYKDRKAKPQPSPSPTKASSKSTSKKAAAEKPEEH